MCVSIYIRLTFVISIPFINYAVCNLSKTFYKREGEILAKIGNEKYRLTLIPLEMPQVFSMIHAISKNFLKSLEDILQKMFIFDV